MKIARFIPCASVIDHHVVLMAAGEMLYAGPLNQVSELDFNRSEVCLVSPSTQAWIKDRADAAIRLNPGLAL